MKFTAILKAKHGAVWGQHVLVPPKFSKEIKARKNQRLLCTINDQLTIHCGQMPDGDGQYILTINKEVSKKIKLVEGDKIAIVLKEDKSKYGMPLPEEMKEILATDPEGAQLFHKLTPGKQRSLLYIIGKPKKSDTRITKALVVMEHLKSSSGKLDYKELNIQFKEYGK